MSEDIEMKFPVELGSVMEFARAVGDANPIYFDKEYAATSELGHLIAPPTFVQSSAHFDPDYPLRPKIGAAWFGSGRAASDDPETSTLGTGLHAEQHFEYRRPIQPGETLTVTRSEGATWEREGRRGGHLRFDETITRYHDEVGELVVTARSIVVRTSRPVEGE